MSRNRRKNAHTMKASTVFLWILGFAIVGGGGLFYVSIKNQSVAFGDQRRACERELLVLQDQNRALSAQVTALTSRSALNRKLAAGQIDLEEIDPVRIVRLGGIESGPLAESDRLKDNAVTSVMVKK